MAQNGVLSVKERLMKLQKQNFRSIPISEVPVEKKSQTVQDEIQELKHDSMIKATPISQFSDAPKDDEGFLELEVPTLPTFPEESEVKERLVELGKQELPMPKPLDLVQPEQQEDTVGKMLKDTNTHLDRVKVALQKVEEIKKKMQKTDNFLGLYYDLNKAEAALMGIVNEVEAEGVEIPSTMEMRINSAVSRKMRD